MNRIRKFAQTSLLTLGATAALGQMGQATQITMVAGGSSAQQGDYRPQVANYKPGAIPQAIEQISTLSNYKSGSQTDFNNIFSLTNVSLVATQGSPIVSETVGDAQIRYIKVGANNYNIIILLRADAGLGVRYVANRMRITALSTVQRVFRNQATGDATGFSANLTPSSPPTGTDQATTVTQDDINVLSYVSSHLPLDIDTGINDLSADSIARFAETSALPPNGVAQPLFGLYVPGLTNLIQNPLPIITLLALYNKGIHTASGQDFPLNLTRNQMFNLLTGQPVVNADGTGTRSLRWSDIDPRFAKAGVPTVPAIALYREKPSGTRQSAVTLLLRKSVNKFTPENAYGYDLDPIIQGLTAASGSNPNGVNPNPQQGTGRMIQTLQFGYDPSAPTKGNVVGYSFVTGTAGNGRDAVRVALFNGVAPYRRNPLTDTDPVTTGASLSLPGNNGQPDYMTVANGGLPYYTETANGRYDLWQQGNFLTLPNKTAQAQTATDLANTLNSGVPAIQQLVNGIGYVQLSQMAVTRIGFTSPITGEYVTDAMSITYDLSGSIVADTNGIVN